MKTLPLVYLVRQPIIEAGTPPLLLLLHGIGSNEHDLYGLAPFLDKRFLIISLRAPNTLGPGSYAWFEADFTPQGPVINPEQAEASRKTLITFLKEAITAYGADPKQVELSGFPFLVVHGTADMVLPITHGRASRELLSSLPVDLTYHEYPMGHEVNQESLSDVTTWLSEQLDKAR